MDDGEFGFEAINEGCFFSDTIASLFDKMSGSLVDVIWVHHASIKGVKFAANGKIALLELITIFGDDFLRNVKVEFVTN